MNSIIVAGNVTRQPEFRYTPSGAAVAKFAIAVNRNFTNQAGAKVEQTDFFDITAWNQLAANVADSINIGTRVIVTGRLQQDRWETDNGHKRSRVIILAEEVAPSLRWATASVTKTPRDPEESAVDEPAADPAPEPTPAKRTRKSPKAG